MANLVALKAKNAERWRNAKLTRGPEFERPAKIAVDHKAIYMDIQERTGVPWVFVAVTHYRESNQNFSTNLGQGDPLNRKTVHVPAGRGPFTGPNAFTDAAVDALVNCAPHAARNTDWSIAGLLTTDESYNGLAYANAGVPSPYIWSGTNQYVRGKVMVDHGPIEPVVDKQLGCAGLILAIMELDPTVTFDTPPDAAPTPAEPVYDAEWVQSSLNKLGAHPALTVDGISGPATRTAVRAFQASKGLTVDGIVGPLTIDALKQALTATPA